METINTTDRANVFAKLSRSWIDVFAGCGTVLGRILSFLDEIDLLQLESAHEGVTAEVTGMQWAYLESLDRSRTTNKKWRQPPPPTDENHAGSNNNSHHLSRLRGIDFANNFLYAKQRAAEAFSYYEYDHDNASPEDIPVRHNDNTAVGGTTLAEQQQKLHHHHLKQSMPPCWQKWNNFDSLVAEGNQALILDVFLDISFHRDDHLLSWRGFRKARYQRYQGISVKLDLESLAKEIGWRELLHFRNNSKDYAFTQYEVEESKQLTKFLMQKTQITMHIAENYLQAPSEQDPLMIIATGGFASPAWARRGTHMVFARNSNICRFHCRNGTQPLSETYSDASRSAFLRIPTYAIQMEAENLKIQDLKWQGSGSLSSIDFLIRHKRNHHH